MKYKLNTDLMLPKDLILNNTGSILYNKNEIIEITDDKLLQAIKPLIKCKHLKVVKNEK